MTIDKAIKEFTEWAKNDRDEMNYWLSQRVQSDEDSPLSYADCRAFAGDAEASAERYEQLAEWLTELKEAKRLLKAALADMNNGGCNSNCYKCKYCGVCGYSERFTWKLTDEASKLLNDEK